MPGHAADDEAAGNVLGAQGLDEAVGVDLDALVHRPGPGRLMAGIEGQVQHGLVGKGGAQARQLKGALAGLQQRFQRRDGAQVGENFAGCCGEVVGVADEEAVGHHGHGVLPWQEKRVAQGAIPRRTPAPCGRRSPSSGAGDSLQAYARREAFVTVHAVSMCFCAPGGFSFRMRAELKAVCLLFGIFPECWGQTPGKTRPRGASDAPLA